LSWKRTKQHAAGGDGRCHRQATTRRRSPGPSWWMLLAGVCNGDYAVDRPPVAHCFVVFFCSFLLLFATLVWLNLLPTKVNKTSKNPRNCIIVRAKLGERGM